MIFILAVFISAISPVDNVYFGAFVGDVTFRRSRFRRAALEAIERLAHGGRHTARLGVGGAALGLWPERRMDRAKLGRRSARARADDGCGARRAGG